MLGLVALLALLPACYDLQRAQFPDAGEDASVDGPPSHVAWAVRAGGPVRDQPGALVGFGDGTFVVAGNFAQEMTFGPGEALEQTLVVEEEWDQDLFLAGYGPSGSFQWARRIAHAGTGSGVPVGRASGGTALADGFALVGSFAGNSMIAETPLDTVFGPGEGAETSLTSAGGRDAFVAAYETNGDLRWAGRGGGPNQDTASAVAGTGDGGLIVVGWFEGEAVVGGASLTQPEECPVFNPPGTGMFVVRYGEDGIPVWAVQAVGCASATDVAALPDDGFLVTGAFAKDAVFGAGETNETPLSTTGPSDSDMFLARYTGEGTLVWTVRAGGASVDFGTAIAAEDDGSSVVAGELMGTAVFGEGEENQTELTSEGEYDFFVARYSGDGLLVWAKGFGGADSDSANDLFVSGDGAATITGSISDDVTFDPGGAHETTFDPVGPSDAFVMRLDGDGAFLWARSDGGNDTDVAVRLVPTGSSAAIVAGEFEGGAVFGAEEPGEETAFQSSGATDVFLTRISWD